MVLLFLAFVGFSFVSAQLTPEVKYPKIGIKEITETTSLGEYISYIFSLAIIIGVLITIGVLIYGGFLYLSSTGNPEQLREAKDRIFAAFWGLAILFGSYLILNTVNPQLVIIRTKLERIERGVILTDPTKTDPDREKVTEISISDIQKTFGATYLPTKLEIWEGSRGQLKAMAFEKPNYEGGKTDWIFESKDTGWSIKSLKVKGIGPGIYLHGPQDKELHLVTDLGDFRKVDDFNDKAEKIEIKNLIAGNEKKTDFAAILHTDSYFKGELRIFIEERDRDGGEIGNVPWDKPETPEKNEAVAPLLLRSYDGYGKVFGASSAHIFQIGPKENCKKVILYKNPNFFDDPDDNNDVCEITNPIYKPVDIEDAAACGNGWKDKTVSIEIDGKCLVVLLQHSTSAPGFPGKQSEVFTANDPDLTDNPIGQCKPMGGVLFWITEPCTSAIAIYPLP